MTGTYKKLAELVRKVESAEFDPDIHGQGVVVAWDPQTRQLAQEPGRLARLFRKSKVEYFFVTTNRKPVRIQDVSFEWGEGTSNIALNFNATFQVKVASKDDAEKLVSLLTEHNSADAALYNIIDEHLHNCIQSIFDECSSDHNLLDYFYQNNGNRGESVRLNSEVSARMQSLLPSMDFRIGFMLNNAPERITGFNHNTIVNRPDSDNFFNVRSECSLTLSSYQLFRKSGIKDIDDVIRHMKKVTDDAVREFILGKSLLQRLSTFEGDVQSISQQIRDSVQAQASDIGYELRSFHTLPDLAPLQLLKGIRVDINEGDAAFHTQHAGGAIRINLSMYVKAINGEFEKQGHLLSQSNSGETVDILDLSYTELVDRVKQPVISMCTHVIKQFSHREASIEFEGTLKEALIRYIVSSMKDQYGLHIDIKSVFPVESEDASRSRELAGSKRNIKFETVFVQAGTQDIPIELETAFHVIDVDIEAGWHLFEGADYGYRTDSPKRSQFESASPHPAGSTEYDRWCKNKAIEDELKSISEELKRYFNETLINKADIVMKVVSGGEERIEMLDSIKLAIRQSRGLLIQLEPLIVNKQSQTESLLVQRDQQYRATEEIHKRKLELELEEMNNKARRDNELLEQKLTLEREALQDFEGQIDTENLLNRFDATTDKTTTSQPSFSYGLLDRPEKNDE